MWNRPQAVKEWRAGTRCSLLRPCASACRDPARALCAPAACTKSASSIAIASLSASESQHAPVRFLRKRDDYTNPLARPSPTSLPSVPAVAISSTLLMPLPMAAVQDPSPARHPPALQNEDSGCVSLCFREDVPFLTARLFLDTSSGPIPVVLRACHVFVYCFVCNTESKDQISVTVLGSMQPHGELLFEHA